MPLWAVILFLGAASCGWLFLKARQQDAVNVKKKVKAGSKTVIAKAKKVAKADISPIKPIDILEAEQPVAMSLDVSSKIAKQLEEIMLKEKF